MITKFDRYINEGVRDQMTPKSQEQIEVELKKMSPDEKLQMGCDKGMLWLVEKAFEEDKDVIKRNAKVLTTAIYNNYLEIVEFLLKNDVDIHGDRDQAILISSSEGYTEILRLLLKAGVDPNIPHGQPLVISALNGHLENVKLLLNFGADMQWADSYIIQTVGIQDNNEEMVKFLLEYKKRGVLKKIKDYTKHKFTNEGVRDQMTPKSEEDVRKAIDNIESKFSKFTSAAKYGLLDVLKNMINDEDVTGIWKNDSLWMAAKRGQTEVVEFLLDNGAYIHNGGDMALINAVRGNYYDTVKLLIDRGANVNANGAEAYQIAYDNNYKEIYKLLQEY